MERSLTIAIVWAIAVAAAVAQDENLDKAEFQRWLEYYQDVAEAYDIRLPSDPDTPLKVSEKPLMSYSNPSSGRGTHGVFFVWTRGGRPEIIGSIWSEDIPGGMRTVMHEFHSLALEPLVPLRIGPFTWAPSKGIELTPLDVSPPKDLAPLRLAQMRSIAQRFTGFSTPHGREDRLTTLRQPLYRYESELPEVIDGAIFGMFNEWDPEIMLLIEARQTDAGPKWYYGIGRFNCAPLRLTYDGEDVWIGEQTPIRLPSFGDPRSNFFAVHQVDRRDAVNPGTVRKRAR